MYSGRSTRALPRVGFPIRKSQDHKLLSTSPGLIAAGHVLLRLLAPRHPPCALRLLIVKNTLLMSLWSFQGALGAKSPAERENAARRRGLSKLSSTNHVEVDVVLGELDTGRRE